MRKLSISSHHLAAAHGILGSAFLWIGFFLALIMRWQLTFPYQAVPLWNMALAPEQYNQLVSLHGSMMIFLGVVPLTVFGFGYYLVPRMVGSSTLALPRLALSATTCYVLAGLVFLVAFFVPQGGFQSGWTSYPPLSTLIADAQSFWLVGIILLGMHSVGASIPIIVTVLHHREAGLSLRNLPIIVWCFFTSSGLLLLAFPPLVAAAVFQLCDRWLGSHFFSPSGLVLSGEVVGPREGLPILWQHLFWFLAHPEVYVLVLPSLGIVAHVIEIFTGQKNKLNRWMIGSVLWLGALSFFVWAHHMYLTGMGPVMNHFFQLTTLLVSVPSIVFMICLLYHLSQHSIQFNTATLFALAFIPMFGLGGFSGLPLAYALSNLYLHDSYYVIGHFHYLVAPGTLFAIFSAIYVWYPEWTGGRPLSERLGKVHFWGSFVSMNGIFLPMFFVGLAGVSRRLYDVSLYAHARKVFPLNYVMTASSFALLLFQFCFIWNLITHWRRKT